MRITCTLNDIRRISIYSIIRVLCAMYLMTLCRYNLYRLGTCFNVIKIMTDNSTRHIFSCTFRETRIKLTPVLWIIFDRIEFLYRWKISEIFRQIRKNRYRYDFFDKSPQFG